MDISSYEQLLIERNEFEEELYNTLISNNLEILIELTEDLEDDDPFWDPVIVCLSNTQIESLETVTIESQKECLICNENNDTFKKVSCCNNKICLDCVNSWFKKSVFCPFCKHDQREVNEHEVNDHEQNGHEENEGI